MATAESDLDWLTIVLRPELLTEKLSASRDEGFKEEDNTNWSRVFSDLNKQLYFSGSGNRQKSGVLRWALLRIGAGIFSWDCERQCLPFEFKFYEAWFGSGRVPDTTPDFAGISYGRWIIRTAMELSSPAGSSPPSFNYLQITPEESKLLQIETDAIVYKVTNQVPITVKKFECFLETPEILDSILVPSFSTITLDSDYEITFSSPDTKPEVSLREIILLDLTSYYFFTEDYERSKYFCTQLTGQPSDKLAEDWKGYRIALDLDKEGFVCSSKPSRYQQILEEINAENLDTGNVLLRTRTEIPLNMDLLRSSNLSSLSSINESINSDPMKDFIHSCFSSEIKTSKISVSEKLSPRGHNYKSNKIKRREIIMDLFRERDPEKILNIVKDIHKNYKKTISIHRLSKKWSPDDNNAMRNSVLKNNHELGDFLYVLNCRLTQYKNIGQYHLAQELYEYLQGLVSIPNNIIQCETLTLNLLKEEESDSNAFTERCKEQIGKNNLKDTNLTILCFARLLNSAEWNFLVSSPKITENRPIFSFTRILALIALSTPSPNESQNGFVPTSDVVKHCKTFSDILCPFFTAKLPLKRGITSSPNLQQAQGKHHLLQLVLKIKHVHLISILGHFLMHLYNVSTEDMDIYNPFVPILPFENPGISVNVDSVMSVLQSLAPQKLDRRAWSLALGEIAFSRRDFSLAMKYFVESLLSHSHYFLKSFEKDDRLIHRMIKCSSELGEYVAGAILCQFVDGCDYSGAFRSLEERQNNADAMDGLYPYFWDVTILEYAVTMHSKRGDLGRKRLALETINNLEINTNNNEEILAEAAANRRNIFFRKLATFFL